MSIKHWIILLTCMIFTMVGVQSTNAQDSNYDARQIIPSDLQPNEHSTSPVNSAIQLENGDRAYSFDVQAGKMHWFDRLNRPHENYGFIDWEYGGWILGQDFLPGDDTNLYGISFLTNQLSVYNVVTEELELIGIFDAPQSLYEWTGLAGDPITGDLFGVTVRSIDNVCINGSGIWRIDKDTGTMTQIALETLNTHCLFSIAIDSTGQIFVHDSLSNSILTVDRETGETTVVGNIALERYNDTGLDFDQNDRLYMVSNSSFDNARITEHDVSTGAFVSGSFLGLATEHGISGGLSIPVDTLVPFRSSISGDVTEVDGTPAHGTIVALSNEDGFIESKFVDSTSSTYTFENLPAGEYTVEPSRPDTFYEPFRQDVEIVDADINGIDFVVDPEPRYIVVGKVTEPNGFDPIVGAMVTLSNSDGVVQSQIVDEGFFAFTNVKVGDYTVTPHKGGLVFTPAHTDITVIDQDVNFIDFIGEEGENPTYSISGKVTEEDQSTPIVGTTVVLSDNAGPIETTTVAAGGSYSFDNISPGEYVITPEKDGYVFTPGFEIVEVVGSDVEFVNFVGNELSISGYVYDVDGEPLEGALIQLGNSEDIELNYFGETTSNADGYYIFKNLQIGQQYEVTATVEQEGMLAVFEKAFEMIHSFDGIKQVDFRLLRDSDGDFLADIWETEGYDYDLDGVVDVPLHLMGADPNMKDIFVQVDYMGADYQLGYGGGIHYHDHAPNQEAIKLVIDAFWDNPVERIHLHVDVGPNSLMNRATSETWGILSRSSEVEHRQFLGDPDTHQNGALISEYNELFGDTFPEERYPIFQHGVFVHHVAGSYQGEPYDSCTSGFAYASNLGVKLFVIALGGHFTIDSDWGSVSPCDELILGGRGSKNLQAGTFMHELGHNMGLHHGGPFGLDQEEVLNIPNQISVMNYTYGEGIISKEGRVFDYSIHETVLSESDLNEDPTGLSDLEGFSVIFYKEGRKEYDYDPINKELDYNPSQIDWNRDDDTLDPSEGEVLALDLNNDGGLTNLHSYNEWAHLDFSSHGSMGMYRFEGLLPNTGDLGPGETFDSIYPFSVVTSGTSYQDTSPNSSIQITIAIQNQGLLTDTYDLEISSELSWVLSTDAPESVELESGESFEIQVTVTTPENSAGMSEQITVVANSRGEINLYAEAYAVVNVIEKSELIYLPLIKRR